jgi:hypothetical protein
MGCGCKNKDNQNQTQTQTQASAQTVQSSQPKSITEDIKQQIKKTVEKYYNVNKTTTS